RAGAREHGGDGALRQQTAQSHSTFLPASTDCSAALAASLLSLVSFFTAGSFNFSLKSFIMSFCSRCDLNSSRRDCTGLRGQALLLVSISAVSQYGSWVRLTIGSSVMISLVIFFGE